VSKPKQQGFTLIEAIVALVIFSTSAMGIYSWINTGLISLQKVEAVVRSEQALFAAVEEIKLIDLLEQSSGRQYVFGYSVEWQAEPLAPKQQGSSFNGSIGLYDLALFELQLSVYGGERLLGEYQYRQVAFLKVRSQEYE